MSIEIATDVAEQIVLVNELEKMNTSGDNAHTHPEACANCGTALQGAFCHACGQSAHIHRSLLHLIEELLHGLFHFETKAWRTIPALIFAPGKLTRNYIEGQRTRYVSPLALFLFLIFLMFFVFSLTAKNPLNNLPDTAQNRAGLNKQLSEVRAAQVSLQARLSAMSPNDPERDKVEERIQGNKIEISVLESSLSLLNNQSDGRTVAKTENDNGNLNEVLDKVNITLGEKGTTSTFPGLAEKIRHAVKTPELTIYKLKSNTSKLAFLLMPISLPFLWLMFIFKRQYGMFDHAVFSLYSLSFMSLLLMASSILNRFNLTAPAILLFVFAPPLHMFIQLRQAYQLGIGACIWRTIALMFVAFCSLTIYLLLIVGMSM